VQEIHPIVARLRELDRSQGWLARKLGVTPSTVNRWIKGVLPMPARRQRELALVLGVRVEDITPKATVAA
jgi:DNA-binding transcriptional regulator YdaS (Cro superfamily)